MIKARAYVRGKVVELPDLNNIGSVILEVELDDGRTVQLSVGIEGRIHLRAWGNIPAKVGNADSVHLTAIVPFEEPNMYWKTNNDTN
jgi:hypothetical protein